MISIVVAVFAVILAAIFVTIAVIASKKGNMNEEGEHSMIKTLFYYLVLFATLMMTIGGSVSAFMAIADIVAPAPYYQSFENFKEMTNSSGKFPSPEEQTEEREILSEEELRDRYEAIVEEERINERNRAVNHLIKSLGWIIIPFPIFLYYQRRMKKT